MHNAQLNMRLYSQHIMYYLLIIQKKYRLYCIMHLCFLQYTVSVTFSLINTFFVFICDVQKCEHVLLIWIQMNLI